MKRVQTQFLVRVLGEPKKFLGMEIAYTREQGICTCCDSQQSYVEKLARNFLTSEQDTQFPTYPTTPMDVYACDKLEKVEEEPEFEDLQSI